MLADENWPELENQARQWAAWQPLANEPWHFAAQAAIHMEQWEQAVLYLESMSSEASLADLKELARLQMEALNLPLQSVATLQRTRKSYPKDTESHLRLLFWYSMTCQRQALEAEVRQAIADGADELPTYAHYFAKQWLTYNNGFQMNHFWAEAEPESPLFEVAGSVHMKANRSPDAQVLADRLPVDEYIAQVRELRKKYPANSELLAALLDYQCEAGDLDAVTRLLIEAASETATDNRFWRYKGWVHMARQEWSQAEQAYNRSLELWPSDWLSRQELATVLRRQNKAEMAMAMQELADLGKDIEQAIRLAPSVMSISRSTYEDLQRYLLDSDDHEVAQALRAKL